MGEERTLTLELKLIADVGLVRLDISKDALRIAEKNADEHRAEDVLIRSKEFSLPSKRSLS